MALDQDTRDFITLSLGNVIGEINRLAKLVDNQDGLLRRIELQSTTRVAELQKDITDIYGEIDSLKKAINNVSQNVEQEENVRQLSDNTLSDRLNTFKETQTTKWESQDRLNENTKLIGRLMWTVIGVVLVQVILLLWSLLINGGLEGYLRSLGK